MLIKNLGMEMTRPALTPIGQVRCPSLLGPILSLSADWFLAAAPLPAPAVFKFQPVIAGSLPRPFALLLPGLPLTGCFFFFSCGALDHVFFSSTLPPPFFLAHHAH